MPIDYSKYPPDWSERRERILERAGYCCEWCGASNHATHPETGSFVILTVAHLDHDPENWDVSDERMAALCQRCHLNYDRNDRAAREIAAREAGQITLFGGTAMTFTEYQAEARKTAVYDPAYAQLYTTLGLSGEAGEVAEQVKKLLRDDHGELTEERKENIRGELGDLLWYAAQVADAFGLDLSDVAHNNVKKLRSRQARGKIQGSGSSR